jgi:hypothetical protein
LRCEILSDTSTSESFDPQFDFDPASIDLCEILRGKIDFYRQKIEQTKLREESMKLESPQIPIGDNALLSAPLPNQTLTIEKMVSICRHFAIGCSIRLIFLQSIHYEKTIWKNFIRTEFLEDNGGSVLVLHFWRQQLHARFIFSLFSVLFCFVLFFIFIIFCLQF